MIFSKEQSYLLWINTTIDLKEITCKEYLQSKDTIYTFFFKKMLKYMAISWVIYYIFTIFFINIVWAYDIKDKIRLDRLKACEDQYKLSEIREQFIYDQVPTARCATYMGLIYAFESWFWTSRRCTKDNNCFGIKWNWYDTPAWFLKFNTEQEGREYFAKKYWQWHYKKDINTFVRNWSMTDQDIYVEFVKNRYWNMYREVEYLYLSWKQF